jgi:hypothetical protein
MQSGGPAPQLVRAHAHGDTNRQDVGDAKPRFPEGRDARPHILEEELQRGNCRPTTSMRNGNDTVLKAICYQEIFQTVDDGAGRPGHRAIKQGYASFAPKGRVYRVRGREPQ